MQRRLLPGHVSLKNFINGQQELWEIILFPKRNCWKLFPFVAFDESGLVGFFTVRIPGNDDRKVRFGFVIVDPMKRGHGYGSRMLRLGLKYAFEIYGANEVSLGVFDNNMAAYHCYKSVGFRENGDRVIYKICGKDWTDIEMTILQ